MTERPYAILEAPSALGLTSRGVEALPDALLSAGLASVLGARRAGRVEPPPRELGRDPETLVLNGHAIRAYALELASAVDALLERAEVPVVLGGDCSILLGPLLALRRRGRFGLLFLDGHADFYEPEAEPEGEVASMELAFATGRGPGVLAHLERRSRLVRDEDVVVLGRRDADDAEEHGSQRIEETAIAVADLSEVRARGAAEVTDRATDRVARPELGGFWIHLDADVVDDALMPAVDYRLPGGLSWDELVTVLGRACASGRVVGIDVTIFNPSLDRDGTIARDLVAALGAGLRGQSDDASRS